MVCFFISVTLALSGAQIVERRAENQKKQYNAHCGCNAVILMRRDVFIQFEGGNIRVECAVRRDKHS